MAVIFYLIGAIVFLGATFSFALGDFVLSFSAFVSAFALFGFGRVVETLTTISKKSEETATAMAYLAARIDQFAARVNLEEVHPDKLRPLRRK